MARPTPGERLLALASAATEVFGRLGYRGTRTADVAARAGMSAGSVFTYVESKEALFHLVFLHGLRLLPESPDALELPLRTPAPGETVALFARAVNQTPVVSRAREALATEKPEDAAAELRGIVEEIYDTIQRAWPLLAVVERCAAELPEFERLWFGEGRAGIYADLAEYLRRRAASGHLRPMPDSSMTARLVGETVTWSAWHRREARDAALFDDRTARRTTIDFVCAALVPGTAMPVTDENQHSKWSVPLH